MSTRGRFDDSNFTVIRERTVEGGPGANSVTDFCKFFSRTKCIVRAVTVHCQSVPTAATSFSLELTRSIDGTVSTIASKTITGFSDATQFSQTFTLVSSNTIASAAQWMAIQLDGTENGKFNVVYEYQWLPPSIDYPEQK